MSEAKEAPQESRWMIGYHLFAGACLAAGTKVVFQSYSILLGALPMVMAAAVGYFISRGLVGLIQRSSWSGTSKIVCKVILFLSYFPLVVLLAVLVGK